MKKIIGVLALCLTLTGCSGQKDETKVEEKAVEKVAVEKVEAPAPAPAQEPFPTFEEKLSYSVGLDIGKSLSVLGDDIQLQSVFKGMTDSVEGNEPLLTPEQVNGVQKEFAAKMQAAQMQKLEDMKKKNLDDGVAYLEENKKKEGVLVTESGLQYEVLVAADGPKPTAADVVKVDYVGTLIDGKEFDSSISRGEPAVFGLDQVIAGWGEAVQLMNVGSKYRFVIPSDIGYGENGAPPVIEPNAVLVFEVELHSIETPAPEAQQEQVPAKDVPAVETPAEETPAEATTPVEEAKATPAVEIPAEATTPVEEAKAAPAEETKAAQ